MGEGWLREEWKPNMVELVSIFFLQKKMLKLKAISFQTTDFQHDIICKMFLHYLQKGSSQNKDEFLQNKLILKVVAIILETFLSR